MSNKNKQNASPEQTTQQTQPPPPEQTTQKSPDPPKFNEYKVKVNCPALNIRESANGTSKVIEVLKHDTKIYRIIEEKEGPGVEKGTTVKWGRTESFEGWIALEFTIPV